MARRSIFFAYLTVANTEGLSRKIKSMSSRLRPMVCEERKRQHIGYKIERGGREEVGS